MFYSKGEVAEIVVQIGGNPIPRIRWYKGSRELFPSMRYVYYIEGEGVVLSGTYFSRIAFHKLYNDTCGKYLPGKTSAKLEIY